MKYLQEYKNLSLKLVKLHPQTKEPIKTGWTTTQSKYKSFKGNSCGVGVNHFLSKTCCFDIDDLTAALSSDYPFFVKLITAAQAGETGLCWTSGKPNRLKILFKLTKRQLKVFRSIIFPAGMGQLRVGALQDVLPPSIHPDGYKYHFIGSNPSHCHLQLPTWLWNELKVTFKSIRKGQQHRKKDKYPFITIYNRHFMKKGLVLIDEILKAFPGYSASGMTTLHRIGSSNKTAVVVYEDHDGVSRAYNFSDSVGDDLLPHGIHDPYSIIDLTMGFDEARHFVTTHSDMKDEIDKAMQTDFADIKRDKQTGAPVLSLSTMYPKGSNFAKVAKSIRFHQQATYNPDMAFWYTLIFLDYLIGTGYESVQSSRCDPLYVFTAGPSSSGKTTTIQSGLRHLIEIGGFGVTQEKAETDEKAELSRNAYFSNKEMVSNVGSSQGLEDLIMRMDHGCDILYVQDEYGLADKGTSDTAGKTMRKMLLEYKTLARNEAIKPRVLATAGQGAKKKEERSPKYCVHFNYFTSATNESLKGVINDAEVGQGYVQRFIGGAARGNSFGARKKILGSTSSDGKIKKSVTKILETIVRTAAKVNANYSRAMDPGYSVRVAQAADDFMGEKEIKYIEGADSSMAKVMENVKPVARVRAVVENPTSPVVTLEIAEWAHEIVVSSVAYFKWLINDLKVSIDGDKPKSVRDIILGRLITCGEENEDKEFTKTVWMRKARITVGKSGRFYKNEYTPVWKSLLESGEFKRIKDRGATGRQERFTFTSVK